jgi:hypothetical protein
MSGYYKNDKRFGEGVDEYSNGERYEANFKNEKKSGYGKYYSSNGDSFEG